MVENLHQTAPKWPHSSPFYNPMTMRASVLEELNDYLIFSSYRLGYIQSKDGNITGTFDLRLQTDVSRSKFETNLQAENPDIVVFFMEHIFAHRHTPDGKNGDMRFTISLDRPTWLWLLQSMKVHPKFVESLYYLLGQYSTFKTYGEDGRTAESFHLLVKVPPAGHLEAAFYLRYDFTTKKTTVLVAGNDLAGHMRSLAEYLGEVKTNSNPFGIIYTLVYRYFYYLEWQRRQLDHAVIMMERVTGRGAINGGRPQDPNPEQFDLQNMHWIGGNQRNVIFAMGFQVKLVTYLQTAHRQFVSLRSNQRASYEKMPKEDKYVQEALQAHKVTVSGVLDNCRVIGERAQWQLNAADSIINTMIAKQSQRTADESKNVAVETRRDSTSMKTIASLTMIYLPSTFVATIFSTGFFDFGSDGSSSLSVNVDIWKLIVVAAVLTIITVSVWILLNKHGVPRLLRWTERGRQQTDNDSNQTQRPARILLDLPQRPGNRANDTVLEASPSPSSPSLSESQQRCRSSTTPVSNQIQTDNGAQSSEVLETSV